MDHVIKQNSAVLDKYDPEKKIWLIVDEWGAWYPVEEGTNPAYLYQQNSMRDAVVAALTLHIFQDHCERVQMANIAQTVNVLQALFLTEGEKMILTPTYHVFDMFKAHMDATYLPLDVESDTYGVGDKSLPAFTANASKSDSGELLLTLANLKPDDALSIEVDVTDFDVSVVSGKSLVADAINAHNTFDTPNIVTPQDFVDFTRNGNTLTFNLPAASVVALTMS
ncbi:MAG: hypothetical protein Crog4KO_36150 [Crocinitomicaceae bacterium]